MNPLTLLAGEEELAPIIMDPIWFPVIAAAFFIVAGLVTWSYRDVSNRHSDTSPSADSQHSQH